MDDGYTRLVSSAEPNEYLTSERKCDISKHACMYYCLPYK